VAATRVSSECRLLSTPIKNRSVVSLADACLLTRPVSAVLSYGSVLTETMYSVV
jgi:hypothetical protein